MSPEHKRASEVSGLGAAEAILFGLAGFQPEYNGRLYINPQLADNVELSVKGFGFRNNIFDVELSAAKMKVIRNGSVIYDGKPERIRIL